MNKIEWTRWDKYSSVLTDKNKTMCKGFFRTILNDVFHDNYISENSNKNIEIKEIKIVDKGDRASSPIQLGLSKFDRRLIYSVVEEINGIKILTKRGIPYSNMRGKTFKVNILATEDPKYEDFPVFIRDGVLMYAVAPLIKG